MKRVTAAIIEKDGQILITQRSREDKLSLKWEFPGGKIEVNETPEECLVREIKEEINIDIQIIGHFMNNIYRYATGEIELLCYFAEITGGELQLNVHEAAEWVAKDRLREFDFAPADIAVVKCLANSLAKRGGDSMIRKVSQNECELICEIINDAAQAYKGIIPTDRWKVPYMDQDELLHEINEGVIFWGYYEDNLLVGVMGIQPKQDVDLIRHAYVRTVKRGQGIGGELLTFIRQQTARPILIGTWADAIWAVAFYKKYGFELESPDGKNMLLQKYWSIPDRQVETSVVLGDQRWFEAHRSALEVERSGD